MGMGVGSGTWEAGNEHVTSAKGALETVRGSLADSDLLDRSIGQTGRVRSVSLRVVAVFRPQSTVATNPRANPW